MEAMEATQITEVAEMFVAETKEDLIKELSNFDLMLVGGGIANVHFCQSNAPSHTNPVGASHGSHADHEIRPNVRC
jgi:hypothetical protein